MAKIFANQRNVNMEAIRATTETTTPTARDLSSPSPKQGPKDQPIYPKVRSLRVESEDALNHRSGIET